MIPPQMAAMLLPFAMDTGKKSGSWLRRNWWKLILAGAILLVVGAVLLHYARRGVKSLNPVNSITDALKAPLAAITAPISKVVAAVKPVTKTIDPFNPVNTFSNIFGLIKESTQSPQKAIGPVPIITKVDSSYTELSRKEQMKRKMEGRTW